MDWKRGPQPAAAGEVSSAEVLVGVIEELMNEVSTSWFVFLLTKVVSEMCCTARIAGGFAVQ